MAKKSRKQRDRPAAGRDRAAAIELSAELTRAADRWAADHGMSRSEAVINLLEQALAMTRPRTKGSRAKAVQLAAEEIDKMRLPSVSNEEKQERKRRLLKGPREFRDIRGSGSKR